jgi:nucleoside-diphosphate-sugar epimerase
MTIVIAGCGWLGRALGAELLRGGHRVVGVRRDPAAARGLRRLGIEPLIADLGSSEGVERLPADADAIVCCQSSAARNATAYREAYLEVTGNLIELARKRSIRHLIYTGSTGVFGQTDGSQVDELSPPVPQSPTAEILVEAERRLLRASRTGVPSTVVRLSGLYGPGRFGVIQRVRQGRLALGAGDSTWMNWCHLTDAVRTVAAVLASGRPGRVYHASDAHPAPRADVVRWIADRLGIEPPRESAAGAPIASRANRRVSAERTRAELDLALAYPSFREGLLAAFP